MIFSKTLGTIKNQMETTASFQLFNLACKVQQPGAAVHEAPYFAEREMEFLMPAPEFHSNRGRLVQH